MFVLFDHHSINPEHGGATSTNARDNDTLPSFPYFRAHTTVFRKLYSPTFQAAPTVSPRSSNLPRNRSAVKRRSHNSRHRRERVIEGRHNNGRLPVKVCVVDLGEEGDPDTDPGACMAAMSSACYGERCPLFADDKCA